MMKYNNPLLSRQGFEFIVSEIKRGCSKQTLEELLNSVVESGVSSRYVMHGSFHPRLFDADELKKQMQVNAFIGILDSLSGDYEQVLEIGSGKGVLGYHLSSAYPNAKILAVESDADLVADCFGSREGDFSLVHSDAFTYQPEEVPDVVVGLHCCGNLIDRLIDIALSSKADVVCVPCCYSEINKDEDKKNYFLPLSEELKSEKEIYEEFLRLAASAECVNSSKDRERCSVAADIYRLLVNYDRLLYMKQFGYDVCAVEMLPADQELNSTPMRFALVGMNPGR